LQFSSSLKSFQVFLESFVGSFDQPAVEHLFASTRFVASYKQNGVAFME